MFEDFFNKTDEDISFNTMAKLSKFITLDGRKVGGRLLKDECIKQNLISQKDRKPIQTYINKGYFKCIYAYCPSVKSYKPCTFITPKGQKWLYNRMLKTFNKTV